MVIKILNLKEDNTSIGKNKAHKSLSRHPSIKGMTGKPLNKTIVEVTTLELIDSFCRLFENLNRDFQFLPKNIWNNEEHGLELSIYSSQREIST